MSMLNKVMLIGNVGQNSEIRVFTNGGKLVSFSLATSEKFINKQGEKQEIIQWHQIRAVGKIADFLQQYPLKKGQNIYCEGKIIYKTYTNKQGQKCYATEINCSNIQVLNRIKKLEFEDNGNSEFNSSETELEDIQF